MTNNLRLSLTVFKIGFAVQSASGFAALLSTSADLPFHGALLLLSPVFSALGILFLGVGRHEWNELHHARVGHANLAFAVSLLATVLAAVPVAYFTLVQDANQPGWVGVEFGASIAIVFAVTFVTYALVASHLIGRAGQVAMAAGLLWAIVISAAIGLALAPQLSPLLSSFVQRSPALDPIARPISLLDALLGFSYLAFFVAFTDAHWRVAKGVTPDDTAVVKLNRSGPTPRA